MMENNNTLSEQKNFYCTCAKLYILTVSSDRECITEQILYTHFNVMELEKVQIKMPAIAYRIHSSTINNTAVSVKQDYSKYVQ
uniref:Uncharacterized protein n=1 Tax=Arundo donax TaxID=35708 RepID=A0A0A9LL50_ARUDO